jgi:hypothetical protein
MEPLPSKRQSARIFYSCGSEMANGGRLKPPNAESENSHTGKNKISRKADFLPTYLESCPTEIFPGIRCKITF